MATSSKPERAIKVKKHNFQWLLKAIFKSTSLKQKKYVPLNLKLNLKVKTQIKMLSC